ncbi:MAG: methyl-accepting chemotaxis protein, partial [Gammaproteobacteria bacterium]|nr:methyl-accepting chemotaxis protein [Gammaproteobacteria bacterium]
MSIFKAKTLNTKFLMLSGFLILVVIAVVGMAIRDSINITSHAVDLSNKEIKVLNHAHQLKLSVVQVQQWLTDISATRGLDGLNDGFDEAENNAKLVRQLINELKSIDPEHASQFESMLPVFDDYYAAGKSMAQAYIDAGPSGGNKMMAQFDEAAASMSEQVDTFLAKTIEQTTASLNTQQELAASSRVTIMVGAVIALIGIALVYFIMSKALSSLPVLVSELNKIAKGDLTSDLEVTREDEIGDLMRGLQGMQEKLKTMIVHISDTTGNLTTLTN